MFSGEYCWIFKITFFEEYLQTAALRCYFDTISHKAICNLALAQPILLKFLFQNENKNNFKNHEPQINSHIYNVYARFCYKILWFYQDFKSENMCFLNLYSVHAARILDLSPELMLSPPKWETKHISNSKGFSFMLKQV